MKPYITDAMKAAHEKGTPVFSPMFYHFPEDKACWEADDQYMFGAEILVAPVMEAGTVSREVYLPKGKSWINVWTGESFEGGQQLAVDCPIDVIPVFSSSESVSRYFG